MEDFQIFNDRDLKEPVSDPINLGKVKAGTSKQFIFYVYNASVHPYEELNFTVDNDEVSIISSPKELSEKSNAEIILIWKPSVDIKRGLKTSLKIAGYQVIG